MSAPDKVMVPAQPPTPPASTMTITSPAIMCLRMDWRVSHLGPGFG